MNCESCEEDEALVKLTIEFLLKDSYWSIVTLYLCYKCSIKSTDDFIAIKTKEFIQAHHDEEYNDSRN